MPCRRHAAPAPISVVTKLAATLRFLAGGGGSYIDIAPTYGLDSVVKFFNKNYFLWKTIDAIDRFLPLQFSLDEEDLACTAAEFARFC